MLRKRQEQQFLEEQAAVAALQVEQRLLNPVIQILAVAVQERQIKLPLLAATAAAASLSSSIPTPTLYQIPGAVLPLLQSPTT